MIRTSVLLPPALHQELVITSRQERTGITALVRQAVEQWLASRRSVQLQRIYDGLDRFAGKGPHGITDASTTINAVLYGKHGVWKGQDE